MKNGESSEDRSIDERLQELKDNAKPDVAENATRYRELQAIHRPKRLSRMFTRKERDANQAGVPELQQSENKIAERSSRAAKGHQEAMTSLAEESAATADANDPQAMAARERLARIRKELNGEQ